MHFASTNENIGILENGLATLPPETLPQTPKRGGKMGKGESAVYWLSCYPSPPKHPPTGLDYRFCLTGKSSTDAPKVTRPAYTGHSFTFGFHHPIGSDQAGNVSTDSDRAVKFVS